MKKMKTIEGFVTLDELKARNTEVEKSKNRVLTKEQLEETSEFLRDMERCGMVGELKLKDGDEYFFGDDEFDPSILVDKTDKVGAWNTLTLLKKDKKCKAMIVRRPMTSKDIEIFNNLKFLDGKDVKFKQRDFVIGGLWVEPSNPFDSILPDRSTIRVELKDGSEVTISMNLYRNFRSIIAKALNLRVGDVILTKVAPKKKKRK